MHVLLNKEFEWFVAFFMLNLYCVFAFKKSCVREKPVSVA